jgi:DNA primase
MRFSQSFLDEIRARLPVSEVVRRRVALKKAGREWKGLSPFNAEKTPSFFVNDQKGFYHCFSSGKHGDQFRFLMETEGLSFREAVERLANLAGVPIPAASPEEEKREARRKTLHEVLELAAKFFEECLQARTGARARGYLADRAISPALQARFRLGYAPAERFALKEYLGNKSIPVALPIPVDPGPQAAKAKQGAPAQRPEAGPVVPLTVTPLPPAAIGTRG